MFAHILGHIRLGILAGHDLGGARLLLGVVPLVLVLQRLHLHRLLAFAQRVHGIQTDTPFVLTVDETRPVNPHLEATHVLLAVDELALGWLPQFHDFLLSLGQFRWLLAFLLALFLALLFRLLLITRLFAGILFAVLLELIHRFLALA